MTPKVAAPESDRFTITPNAAAWRRHGLAVAATAAAVLVDWVLHPWLGGSIFPAFLAGVMIAAWYGGLGPGLLASVLSALAAGYLFLAPRFSFSFGPQNMARLAMFAAAGYLTSALSERLHRARRAAQEQAATSARLAAELQEQAAVLQEQAAELERQAEEAQDLTVELESQVAESEALRGELAEANDRLALSVEESRAAGERMGSILRTMNEGVVLADRQGRLTYANPAAARLLHIAPGEIAPPVALGDAYVPLRADGTAMSAAERPVARVLGTGLPLSGEEIQVVSAGGSRATLRVSAAPVRGAGGATEGVVATFQDVTEAREAQAARQAEEERFRATFEQAAVGIAHVGLDGRWLRVNRRLCDILGYPRQELLAMTFQQVTHPDDVRADEELARRVAAGEIPTYTLEKRYLRRDGSPLWINLTVALARGGEGQEAYFISVIEDIQARRAAQAALRESEERFRALADTAPVLVWTSGPGSARDFFNKPWLNFTGRSMEQELGSGWTAGVHPEDLRRCLSIYTSSFDARRPFRMEYRLRRADGEHRWVLDTGIPRFLPDGAFSGYAGSCIDITERREAEEQLRFLADAGSVLASSLDYERTLEQVVRLAVPVLGDYCVLDLLEDGEVRRVAAAHADPAMQPLVRALLGHAPALDGPGPVAQALRSGAPRVMNEVTPGLLARTAEGAEHLAVLERLGPTALMSVPLQAGGRVLGSLLFVATGSGRRYDEAEVARAEELARRAALAMENARLYEASVEANRAKSDFLAVMSHELRTPLNAILGYADLFLLGIPAPLPGAVQPQMERLRAAGRHLLSLIEEILTFARLEAGQEEVHVEPGVGVADLVQDSASLVEPLAIERGLRFTAGCADAGLAVATDPRKARQVLVNLLGNAIKFTDRGQVSLAARRAGGQVLFEVRDTGIGIAPEHLERIFEAFWQVEQTTIRRHEGSGLGLSVARRLARLLGGDITTRSTPGEGSVFTFALPA
jgi:PAS domain S-box-containing protein